MTTQGAPALVRDIMHSAFLARALYALVQLDIPDLVAANSLSSPELAGKVGVDPGPLRQLLRAGASAGLFTTREDSHGVTRYSLTDAGMALTKDHPSATRDLITCFEGPIWRESLTVLPARVAGGRTGPEIAHGAPLFELLSNDPEAGAAFDRLMTAQHGGEHALIAAAADLEWAATLVDVGGGTGGLLTRILAANPRLSGTLFDQPAVLEHAGALLARSAVADRCAMLPGNFFHEVPAGADVYLLSHILHDWDDDQCRTILRTCAAAMTPQSRLLIVESILPDDDATAHPARMLDLVMLAVLSGRERTLGEYRQLLESADLRLRRVVPTGSPVSVLECVR
ncbi:hypothetical protein D5S18_25965 [Nocardia panacis]|uniref:Uncharacterized protein n=1 Tax=Nocardia panacis TaxID=2340916 RepID=A0A3A4KB55_9NOCA|nr:methyltransferase [Nocardia panacis]RJO70660.1 hypothetical protein D5S18_25965 [Nocardia panacis]